MTCYRMGGCGPYEGRSCSECPASKITYLERYKTTSYRPKEDDEWNWFDFINMIESIAVGAGFRLFMHRSPLGCGIFFYFQDDRDQTRSRSIVWLPGKECLAKLWIRLNELAAEFKITNPDNEED